MAEEKDQEFSELAKGADRDGTPPEQKQDDVAGDSAESATTLFDVFRDAIDTGAVPRKKALEKAIRKNNSISGEQTEQLVDLWFARNRNTKNLRDFLRVALSLKPRVSSWNMRVAKVAWSITLKTGALADSPIAEEEWGEYAGFSALLYVGNVLAETRTKKPKKGAQGDQATNLPDRAFMRDILECLIYSFLLDDFGDAGGLLLKQSEKSKAPSAGPQTVRSLVAALAGNAAGVTVLVRDRLSLEIQSRDHRISELQNIVASVETQRNALDESLSQLQASHAQSLETIRALELQLGEAKVSAKIDGAHIKDDLHRVRSKSIKLLETKVKQPLEDVLKAISRDPPKINVAEDYIKRAIDAIEKELPKLRGDE